MVATIPAIRHARTASPGSQEPTTWLLAMLPPQDSTTSRARNRISGVVIGRGKIAHRASTGSV